MQEETQELPAIPEEGMQVAEESKITDRHDPPVTACHLVYVLGLELLEAQQHPGSSLSPEGRTGGGNQGGSFTSIPTGESL